MTGSVLSAGLRFCLLIACLTGPTCLSAAAFAQSESTEAKDEAADNASVQAAKIQNPVPLETLVPAIAGDWEATQVVLSLVIDAEGKVTDAQVVSGSEPFSGTAVRAAPNFRFQPAQRDGKAVASKIYFLVTFEPRPAAPPEPEENTGEPSEEEPEASEGSSPSVQASGKQMDEVVVYGKIPDPGSIAMTRAEVRNLAGAFDDPLRSVEVMPGVTPIATGLPLFFIRGAPPGNVGYYIDGIRVPLLYHAFLGPSVIHPAFIKNVSLNGGPIPTRFGRYAGGAVEAELSEPSGAARAEASVRLIDAGGYVEAPLHDGRGYALLGGRYSYTALLISLFSPGQRLDYWDYQGLVGYSLGRKDEISLLALGAFDYVGANGEVLGGTEFHRLDLRWDHRFDSSTDLRLAATWGRDRTRSDSGYLSDNLVGGRMQFEHRTRDAILRAGADGWMDRYKMEVDAAIAEPEIYFELFPERTDGSGGVWTDVVLFPHGRVQVIPGIRADLYSSLGQERYSIDPRLFAEYRLTKKLRAIHGIGVAHQSPNFVPNIPGAQVAGLSGGLQQSLQASTKYEADLPSNLTGSVAFFLNGTKNMTDPIGLGQSLAIDETSADSRAQGRAMGVEFYLKRPLTRNLGGLISYTFSRSTRSFGPITTVPGYDRPHVLNSALTYDFGYHIRASGRFAIASGIPGRRTTLEGLVYDESRSGPYIRVDLKIAKKWYVSEHFNWGAHIEVLNATHTSNVSRRICSVDGCRNEGTAPITFPSLGVEASWQ